MKNFKLGLCSVSFKRVAPEEILKGMLDAGLKYIEWAGKVHAPYNDFEKIKNLLSLQRQYGIECSSYGTYFYLMHNELDELKQCINVAKMLGTSVLRIWTGKKGSKDYTDDEKEKLFEECRRAADIAEKENVTLCMEFHNNSFTDTAKSSIELMEAVNSPNFKMYWQPNSTDSEDVRINNAQLLSPYTVNIHVFHSVDSVQKNLLDGIELWKKYLNEFPGGNTLLLEFMPDGKLESLSGEAKALKNIVSNII